MPGRPDREELLKDIDLLLKQLDEDKGYLSRPYADIFSFTALPFLLYFCIDKSNFLQYLANHFGIGYYKSYYQDAVRDLLNTDPGIRLKHTMRNEAVMTVAKFEQQIVEISKVLIGNNTHLQDYLGIKDLANETSWPFPYRLDQFPSTGDEHLLFKIAHYIDMFPEADNTKVKLKSGFVQALNAVLNGGFRTITTPSADLVKQIPELKERIFTLSTFDVYSNQISTHRAAEILRTMYPDLSNFEILYQQRIEQQAEKLAQQYIHHAEYFVALVAALLAKGFLINPLAKRIFPLGWYLTKPINTKLNYNLLSTESLLLEKNNLEEAHRQLMPYVRSHQRVTLIIALLVVFYGLYLLVEGFSKGGFFFLKLAYTPLLIGVIGEKVVNYYTTKKDQQDIEAKIKGLIKDIKYILGEEAENCIAFEYTNRGRLSLSILKLTVKNSYHELPRRVVADVLKQTLHRFAIRFLPFYTRTEFHLAAQTTFKSREAMLQFCKAALERALSIYQLKLQMRTVIQTIAHQLTSIDKNIQLDNDNLYTCEHIFLLKTSATELKNILTNYKFVTVDNYLVLNKNEPYSQDLFNTLIGELLSINKTSLVNFAVDSSDQQTSTQKKKRKKSTQTNLKQSLESTETASAIPQHEIQWPCGATYHPNAESEVKVVRGAINRFSLWTLTKQDFGEHANAHDDFKAKSEQKASKALDRPGIKERPTLGTYANKQRLFPAHIKIPGPTYGDQGVVMDIEEALTGEKLYITRAFEPSIHKGIK